MNEKVLGKIDKGGKSKRIRLTESQKEIFADIGRYALGVVITGTVLSIALTAPKLIEVFSLVPKRRLEKYSKKNVEQVLEKFYKDRYIEKFSKNGKEYLKITERGRKLLVDFNIDTITIQKQAWDKKWRAVIFDIPEKLRLARRVLRAKLKEIGFVKIQKSVWICPYECENEVSFIASTYEVEHFVNYMIVEKIDIEDSLRVRFDI